MTVVVVRRAQRPMPMFFSGHLEWDLLVEITITETVATAEKEDQEKPTEETP